ncbi:hypothetical protein BGZ80_006828 [Entomortierella chlamydospora]|uniref:5-nucleotidase n=1 Tax=Entomortierella chlamydospora TaxID=101097 RepID=A0A9P6N3M1_9FUNG|nr:hypothetical protein BGZ80_006828 [Entomortierella chlamydospora]
MTAIVTSALPTASNDGWLNLTVIHTNDVHSRVDPANDFGVSCTSEDIATGHCYGGTARHKTIVERLRKSNKHSLLLDGGDEFQGTLFYTYYKGNVTAEVMNELGYDLGTIGNHEWDNGPDNLGQYWPKLKFPIICANVDLSKKPELEKWVKPYHIFEDIGVAVIGYITNTTGDISNAGPDVSFTDPIPVVQKYVDELEAKGIKRIFGLSHNGYGPDMELAANTHGIDLIVGGHSHSYLGDPSNPLSEGPYPTVIKNLKGENTLIVQAFCWGRYIGHLDVVFNPEGKIVSWEGAPILVENSVTADPRLLGRIDDWRHEFEEWGETVLGVATDSFDQASCKQRECTMGDFVADAMLEHARTPIFTSLEDYIQNYEQHKKEGRLIEDGRPWTDLAFINSGGIRSGLPAGNITIEMIMTTSPFGNGLVQAQMSGEEILDILEAVASGRHKKSQKQVTSNIQISGLRYIFDSSRPLEEPHLIKAEVEGYDKVWREIKKDRRYWVVTLDFVLTGGDNIVVPKEGRREIKLEVLDKVLMDYIEDRGKITPYLDGRIKDISPPKNSDDQEMFKTPNVWPPATPEHIKSQYPGGVEEMLRDYNRLREGGARDEVERPEDDSLLFEDMESRQEIWS